MVPLEVYHNSKSYCVYAANAYIYLKSNQSCDLHNFLFQKHVYLQNVTIICNAHIHGTLTDVISTVHDTWLDGSPFDWENFRSSPVTRSHGVP